MNRYHLSSVFDLKTGGPSPRLIAPLPMQSATKSYVVEVRSVDFSSVMNLLHGRGGGVVRSSLVKR